MSVEADMKRIEAHWPRIEAHLVDAEYCGRRDEGVSSWGVGQQLLHLLRAQKMICGGIARMLAGSGPPPGLPAPPPDSPEEFKRQVLAGGIPRGVGDAPEFLRVDAPPEFEVIRKEFDDAREAWAAVSERSAEIGTCEATFPHHRLGSMNAAEWLRFIAHHNDLHLGIIDDILADRT
jgi:hypothetical protein